MRKTSSLLGQDVISLATSERLHKVKDVVINQDNNDIVALVLQEGGFRSDTLVVPVEAVSSFGKDAIVIPDADAVGPVANFPEVQPLVEHRGKISGRKVFTETGEDHGSIKDMYFDEQSGRVLGFEVSGGLAADIAGGTSFVSIDQVVRTGPDIVYIKPEAVVAMEAQEGGIKGAVSSAGSKLEEADQSLQAAGQQQEQHPEQAVIGRRSQAEITDETGAIVVALGQRITPQHVERARETGNLPVLLQSAPPPDGSLVSGEQARDSAEAVGDKAGSLWDAFTRKVGEMTDAQGKRVDEAQTKQRLKAISDAVGRPVTKVILDRQDNVVLNLGDIITHEAVQRAYDSNALDSLLGAAYKGDVTFERDEMKAPVEGESTVEKASGDAPIVDELQQKVETVEREREEQKQAKHEKAEADRQQREEERTARAEERDQQAQDRGASDVSANHDAVDSADRAADDETPTALPAKTTTKTR